MPPCECSIDLAFKPHKTVLLPMYVRRISKRRDLDFCFYLEREWWSD